MVPRSTRSWLSLCSQTLPFARHRKFSQVQPDNGPLFHTKPARLSETRTHDALGVSPRKTEALQASLHSTLQSLQTPAHSSNPPMLSSEPHKPCTPRLTQTLNSRMLEGQQPPAAECWALTRDTQHVSLNPSMPHRALINSLTQGNPTLNPRVLNRCWQMHIKM